MNSGSLVNKMVNTVVKEYTQVLVTINYSIAILLELTNKI